VVVLLILLVGCGGDDSPLLQQATDTPMTNQVNQELVVFAPEGGKFVFGGIERFMRASGLNYEIQVMEGLTTDLVIDGLKDGAFDMVFIQRHSKRHEGITFFELFRVNVAIFTHPDVGVDSLTTEELTAIFSGEITNWSQVGGRDQEMALFILPESDSITEAVRTVMLGDRAFSEAAHPLPSEKSVIQSATGIPGGVGYATWATKQYLELVGPERAENEFHAVLINGMALDDPDYPLSTIVGFGYLPERSELLEPLFAWITEFLDSPQGQKLLQLFDVSAPAVE
jgi:hypothetical protein